MRLAGKIAAVTGAAGNGIGRAIALAFAREGADVAVLDIRPAAETLALVKTTGRRAAGATVDLGTAEQAIAGLEQISATLGSIDILVNAAAAITRKPFLDLTLDDWDGVHRVDLRAYFVTGQWVAREMVRRGRGGSIINVASVGSLVATREQVHYCAAKGGVLMLTRGMAAELAPHGIRVNAISPGTIETDFNRHLLADPQFRSMRATSVPLGRVGLSEEIAGAAVLLASNEGSFMVGANVVIDGGQTIL